MPGRRHIADMAPRLVAGLILALLVCGAASSAPPTGFTVGCNNWFANVGPLGRSQARSYAYSAAAEGYQWGGGCWNDNDRDDSLVGTPDSEGPDCSGFSFKAWYERAETGDPWFRFHSRMQNVHGPYTAASFKNGVGAPNLVIGKGIAVVMDAFASAGHIGMIYWAHTAYNEDRIIEARCDPCGTGIWPRTYRGNPDFGGVRRLHWA